MGRRKICPRRANCGVPMPGKPRKTDTLAPPNLVLAALSVTLTLSVSTTVAGEAANLTVRASGFAHARGTAIAKLFASGDNVLGRGRWQSVAAISGGKAVFEFSALAAGSYAVVVFHDVNDNGTIDHNALGFPSEPLGFSNGFTLGLTTGLPTFEKLRFEHGARTHHIDITVR